MIKNFWLLARCVVTTICCRHASIWYSVVFLKTFDVCISFTLMQWFYKQPWTVLNCLLVPKENKTLISAKSWASLLQYVLLPPVETSPLPVPSVGSVLPGQWWPLSAQTQWLTSCTTKAQVYRLSPRATEVTAFNSCAMDDSQLLVCPHKLGTFEALGGCLMIWTELKSATRTAEPMKIQKH